MKFFFKFPTLLLSSLTKEEKSLKKKIEKLKGINYIMLLTLGKWQALREIPKEDDDSQNGTWEMLLIFTRKFLLT